MIPFPEKEAGSIKEQVRNLSLSINKFTECIVSLPDNLFLKRMDDWSPRDVTAHLVGWNRFTIEGGRQLLKGKTPSYFFNTGEDFSKINAVLVQKYDSRKSTELMKQLGVSAEELKQFLLTLSAGKWNTDYGVRWNGGAVTVKNTVDALIMDYDLHKREIEKWAIAQIAEGVA